MIQYYHINHSHRPTSLRRNIKSIRPMPSPTFTLERSQMTHFFGIYLTEPLEGVQKLQTNKLTRFPLRPKGLIRHLLFLFTI